MFFLPENHYVEAGGKSFIVVYDPVTQNPLKAYPAPPGMGRPLFSKGPFKGSYRRGVLCYAVPVIVLFKGSIGERRICVEVENA